ncbi:MAG: bifunctional diguanylate cyclase/phosphodiesterase [Amaricoccus sp.]
MSGAKPLLHPPHPDERLAAALFRMLAAEQGFAAAGLLVVDGERCRLIASTPSLAACRGAAAAGQAWAVPAAARSGKPSRIAPDALSLVAGFAALAPVTGADGRLAGLVLVADRRARRMSPALAIRLADAALLARPAFPRAPQPAAAPAMPPALSRSVLKAAVRPRAAAQRFVDSALRARRPPAPFGLMIIDIDRFRAVNEAMGVAAGDALLAVTGIRLEQALDPGDRLVRIEGDRFLVVATRDPAGFRVLARRLMQAVGQPLGLDGGTVVVQASIGIALAAPGDNEPASLLMMRAETALRRAKIEGRARFALHEPVEEALAYEKSRLELDLASAVDDSQLHLVYQPYVDLRDGRVSGAEALLRWDHPLRGELPPAAFIPLAEATGQILKLGRWALRTALASARAWPATLSLAVNISPLQFHQPGFLAEVDAALADTCFPPERLELEITETVLMRDNPETTAQLRALIARGIRIALDDFGTGYSALAYLARLPHHRIKLDKAFVQDIANPATAELIRAIIALARAQGVAVTAEGVERPEHLALVRRAGFTHAQGYATGTPVAEPAALLGEWSATPS